MPRPSVIPGIKARLEEYLDQKEAEYLAQNDLNRQPTLPCTPDGKINVRAVATAIDLTVNQEKYLFERKELTDLINCIAEGQALLSIGSRLHQSASDKAIKARLTMQAKSAQEDSQAAVEAVSAQQELLSRIAQLSTELEETKAENVRLRAQLDAVREGLWVSIEP
jgi:nitrogen fixation/metabolism regulation signal transduction histidine kinase